ncbi:hypothetical protein QN277_021279 [Acacia crassicarpa]|uniref:Uncharacterized protein n=1 Tax=Acacia crassicarpa TaxID=499986 RepID=A0AAE1JL79_9FABA|nr:hypothetical protein QN277_021279 [Acacia crassicarpa]
MGSETKKKREKKRRGGTKKKLEGRGHGGMRQNKSGEWFESFVERDVGGQAPGIASMNQPHDAASSLRRFHSEAPSMEGEATETCDGSGFAWDMRLMGEMGLGSNYWDEEEVFNMPALVNSMAEGLLVAPPALQTGFNWLPSETPFHFSLWAD